MTQHSRGLAQYIVLLIKQFVGEAGTTGESNTDRDGFLSHKAETHALGMGLAAGFYFGARGETRLLSVVYGAAVYGKAHWANGQRRRLLMDIRKEPHYALGGVVAGVGLGAVLSEYRIVERLVELQFLIPAVM